MVEQTIQDKYFGLLKAHVSSSEETYLAAAAELGHELVLADVPPEDVAEIHEEALQRLAQESPDMTAASDAARLISAPLTELLMAYGLAFREQLEIRKQTGEALRRSEETARVLLNAPTDFAMLIDREGTILALNETMAQRVGRRADELVGVCIYDLIPPDIAESRKARVDEVIRSGKPVRFEDEREGRIVDHSIHPVFDAQGKVERLAVFARDITERKHLEEQMRRQERLATVGRLAGGIAHDFKNFLTTIILYAQTLLRKPHLPADLAPALETIINESRGAARLVQQILDFSRRSTMETRPVDLVTFIKAATDLLWRTLPENIRLHIEAEVDECVVNADPMQVQQALMNLATNARDAMPEGGELRIALSRVEVNPGEESPVAEMDCGEWVCLAVSDTGTGMPPEMMSHLFEPFFTTKPVGQGTGLGLAQVYGIVKQHEGHIGVETEAEQGTTFRIYLPVYRAEGIEDVSQEEEEDLALPSGKGESILLAEDEERLRESTRRVLESLGYQVLTAADGQEALEVYRSAEKVDLVLTDMVMPKMGGKKLIRELKKMDPHLKGLAITGYALEEDLRELKEEGAIVDVVHKPFDTGTLEEAVRQALHPD